MGWIGEIRSPSMFSPNTSSLTAVLEKLSDNLDWIGENRSPSAQSLTQHPRLNNNVKRDLPLPDRRIGALEPPLYSGIIHGLLLYYIHCYMYLYAFTHTNQKKLKNLIWYSSISKYCRCFGNSLCVLLSKNEENILFSNLRWIRYKSVYYKKVV